MMTLNPFVENNKARINQFLNNLCEVVDFYETLEVWVYCSFYSTILTHTLLLIDGSVHGPIQERPSDQHYSQRVVQYPFPFTPTH